MRIKHLIYSTVVTFLTTTTGIGTIAAQTSVTATEDLEFNMKADSREGYIDYITGIDQNFKPITNQEYQRMSRQPGIALYRLAGLKKSESQTDQITITFNYDNCLSRELWQNTEDNDKTDDRFNELSALTTHIFDGGYKTINDKGQTVTYSVGTLALKPGTRIGIKPIYGRIKYVRFYHHYAYSNLHGNDYSPIIAENPSKNYWDQKRANANIRAIRSFDDPTELTDIKPEVLFGTLGSFQGINGTVPDLMTEFKPADKAADLGKEFFLEVRKDGCIGFDGTTKIDLVNCSDDAFRFTHIMIGIARDMPTGAPELTIKSDQYKETTTDNGGTHWTIWDKRQVKFSINEKYGQFNQLSIKYILDGQTAPQYYTPADAWNQGWEYNPSSSLPEITMFTKRIYAVGQIMKQEGLGWVGTGEYTPVRCVEIERINNHELYDPALIDKNAKAGDIVTITEFTNMIASAKIGDKYVAFIRNLSEGKTTGGHTLKLVSDTPFPDSWKPSKPNVNDRIWDKIIDRRAIQGRYVKTYGDRYLMVDDGVWDFTPLWKEGQYPFNVQVRRTNPGSTGQPEWLWVHNPDNTAGPKSTYPDDWYKDAPGDCTDLMKVQLYAEQRVVDLGGWNAASRTLVNKIKTNKVKLRVDTDVLDDYWIDTSMSFDDYMTSYPDGKFAIYGLVDAPIGSQSIFERIIYPQSIEVYPKGRPAVKNFDGSAFDVVADDMSEATAGTQAYKFIRLRPVSDSDPLTFSLDPSKQWSTPAVDYIVRSMRGGKWVTVDTIAGNSPFSIDSDAYFDSLGVARLSITPIIGDLKSDSLTVTVRNIINSKTAINGAQAFKDRFAEDTIGREAYTDLKGRFVVARKHRGTLASPSAARSRSAARAADETTWLYLRDLSDTDSEEFFMIHGDNLEAFNEGDIFVQLTILPERFDGNVVADISGLETLAMREIDATGHPVTLPEDELATLSVAHRMDLCSHESHTHYSLAATLPESLRRYDLLSLHNVGVRVDSESGEYFAQLAEDLPIGFHLMGGDREMIAGPMADNRNARLDLHGVMITGPDGRWILELERASATPVLQPTVIAMTSGGDDAEGLFATYATVTVNSPEEGAAIYYRINGGAYSTIEAGEPITIGETSLIDTYSCRPGTAESAVVARHFTKTTVAVHSVSELMSTLTDNRPHHIMNTMVVAEVVDNVMMVSDAGAHWIALWNPAGWGDAYKRGDNVADFIVNIPDDHTRFFTIDPDNMPQPLTGLTTEERLRVPHATVREIISDADAGTLVAMQGGQITTDTQVYTVSPEADRSIVYSLNPAPLGLLDWMAAPEGEVFVITSYVMSAPDGSTELWPIRLDAVRHTYDPEIIADEPVFVGSTEFTVDSELGAYVWWSTDGGATWNEYPDAPVTIDRTCTVSVYAQFPGLSDSQTVTLDFTREYVSGDVEIQAAAIGNGYVDVEIVPGEPMGDDDYRIYCTTDGTEPQVKAAHRYKGALRLRSTAVVKALMVEEGKRPGAVNACEVIVPQGVSGAIKIHFKEGDGVTAVIITPFYVIPQGSYSIYYTTDGSEPQADPAMLYDGSALMFSEPCTVKAMLVQDGMLPGEVLSQAIRILTGISAPGSDSDPSSEVACSPEGMITAPEGSRLYDMAGRLLDINATLRKGVYIVVTPDGKAVKILVR